MVITINLSKPLDFYPLSENFIPIELFNIFGDSIFEENLSSFSKFFPDFEIIVLENEVKQNIVTEMVTGELFLPVTSFYEKIFLLASFINSYNGDPKILLFPGNLKILDFKIFVDLVNVILRNDILYSHPIIFFVSGDENFDNFVEKTCFLEKIEDTDIFIAKKFISVSDYITRKDKENLFGFTGIFYMHSLKLKEIFCSVKEVAELYFEFEEGWGNRVNWNNMFLKLKKIKLDELIMNENPFVVKYNGGVKRFSNFSDLFDFFKTDENNNIVKGNFEYSNVKNSILINQEKIKIFLKNQTNILCLAKNSIVRMEKI